MSRFQPSMESLETRETPSGLSSVPDASSDSYYGTGVYKSTDSGKTWTLAPDTTAGRITGIAVDPSDAADGRKYKMLVAPLVLGADEPRYFNGFVSRLPAGGSDEPLTIGGPRTEADAQPTIVLQRLANPSLPADTSGNVYTVTFGGSL